MNIAFLPGKFLLTCVLSLLLIAGHSQFHIASGRVFDAETNQPLAFVNIVINQSNIGGVSDIDGRFKLVLNKPIHSLRFSYVGYAQQIYHIEDPGLYLVIRMERLTFQLPEVSIVAGENPAHRIIENAIRNRDHNNYERLPSFSYTSYDKMILTVDTDTLILTDTLSADSSLILLKEYLSDKHFFIMETLTKREFLYPGRDHQKVVASKVSGFNNPIFTFLISQIQSTSFYDEIISISDKNYVNPISQNSTARYSFIIEDTLIMAGTPDTTFVISYRPRPNTNFDGLRGLLHINSKHWAIQNVIAEPALQEKGVVIKIQQMYSLINGMHWFPVQLNTDIIFKNVLVNGYHLEGRGKSYITNIEVNPQLERSRFNEVNIDVGQNAAFVSDEEWEKLRVVELSEKDKRTYLVMDSIGKEHNFDRYALMLESLLTGNIPVGKFNIPMNKLLRYNEHEKIYLGFGLTSSPRFSRIFNVGAYAGYGFGDNRMKYGGKIQLNFHRFRDAGWFLRYANDLDKAGKVDPFKDPDVFYLDEHLNFLNQKNDHIKIISSAFQCRIFPYLLATVQLDRSWKAPQYDYFYTATSELPFPKAYVFTEMSAGFRFMYREKIIQTGRSRTSLGSDYPSLWFRFTQGLNGFLDGQFQYQRYDVKIEHSFFTKLLGETSVLLRAGLIDSDLPYMQLYSNLGSYARFNIHSSNNFATMRVNEFTADHHVSIFLSHDFGKLLFRTKHFEPEFVIATHVGFAWLKNQVPEHHNIELRSFERGYFESGLLINNILNLQFYTLGLGAFYRYGPYAHKSFQQNLALRMNMVFLF